MLKFLYVLFSGPKYSYVNKLNANRNILNKRWRSLTKCKARINPNIWWNEKLQDIFESICLFPQYLFHSSYYNLWITIFLWFLDLFLAYMTGYLSAFHCDTWLICKFKNKYRSWHLSPTFRSFWIWVLYS